jgi:nucleoside-diphosphate-sugar epimerase
MTKVLIIGGGGMVGQTLAKRIVAEGLNGAPAEITLFDVGFLPGSDAIGTCITGSLTDPTLCQSLAAIRADYVYHLAAIVSGEAEADFGKGWQINMFGTWHLLEALRMEHEASGGSYRPRLVFTSSIAVFGPPYPEKIPDDFLMSPRTSYGAQKASSEMMVSDFSRKGYIDGLSIRLPTICVRPGKPNKAASSFFSGIIREPLNGVEAILPVSDDVRHWHATPRSAAGFLTHAASLDTSKLDGYLSLNMPGVSCTVAEQIEALKSVAGNDVAKLIRREPDETVIGIVAGWPRNFDPIRSTALGFKAETDFETIIRIYIEDENNG